MDRRHPGCMGGSATGAPLATPLARRARARILELSRTCRADEAFLEEVSTELRHVIPFDGAFWSAMDPQTSLATAPSRVENLASAQACEAYWATEFLGHDFLHFRDLARAERPAGSLYRATEGRLTRSERYRSVNRLLGFGDELRSVFRTDRSAWGLVSLWRHEGMPEFTLAEEKLLADLSVPVAEAFRRSALMRHEVPRDASDAPGLLIFSSHGVLESLNEQAQAWLSELQPTTILGAHLDSAVPTEIHTVSARARAIAMGLDTGVAHARIQTRTGRWLIVHGFSLRDSEGENGRAALVIEPARASQIAPLIVEAYNLTPREQEVTELISSGLSTGGIAAQLHLSAHTVRDHVKSVFEKVRVSSRGELVSKIFPEHYVGPLETDIVHTTVDDAI